ncbi:hypothetical protein ACIGCZ_00815 [Streptomyces nigra]|uniref:hypothetical protein n=1 Tax=Streptomyces nigra TaxID=1827580 RepID=UPI0037CED3B9
MTPLDRLLLEAVPVRPEPAVHSVWTQHEQDEHWDDLCRAVGTPGMKRPKRPAPSEEAA